MTTDPRHGQQSDGRIYGTEEQVAAAILRVQVDKNLNRETPWYLKQLAELGFIEAGHVSPKSD